MDVKICQLIYAFSLHVHDMLHARFMLLGKRVDIINVFVLKSRDSKPYVIYVVGKIYIMFCSNTWTNVSFPHGL